MVATKYFILFLFFCLSLIIPAGVSAYDTRTSEFAVFSSDLQKHFGKLGWSDLHPERISWTYYRRSQMKRPLIYTTFGENTDDITLMLAGVHGDENPSVYVMFRLAEFLKDNPALYRNKKIIIAPLVNPDGFFKRTQTRTNAAGVDLNRNFPTRDWRPGKKKPLLSGADGQQRGGDKVSDRPDQSLQTDPDHQRPLSLGLL